MTDYAKVSELPLASSIADTDLIEISQDQGGSVFASKKVAGTTLTSTTLKLNQTTPQPTVGTFTFPDVRVVNSGTVTRVGGLISSISIAGSRTMTFTRNAAGYVTGMTDGSKTWTYTRDVNNNLTAWSVS